MFFRFPSSAAAFLRLLASVLLLGAFLSRSAEAATGPNLDRESGRLFLRIFVPYEYRGDYSVTAIAEGPDGVVYLGAGKAVHAFDGFSWTTLALPEPVLALERNAAGEVLAGTALATYRVTSDVLGRRSLEPVPGAPRLAARDSSMLKLSSGLTSIVQTGGAGVRIALPGGNEWQINRSTGMENAEILCQYEDKLGGLWLGTRFGVARADLPSPWTLFLRADGVERSRGVGIVRWQGRLVVAQESGVYALEPAEAGGQHTPARFRPLPFPAYTRPQTLLTAGEDLLLAAENGLHVLRPGAPSAETLTTARLQLAAALPGRPAVVAFSERELWWVVREEAGWVARAAPHGLPWDFTSAAAGDDGTIWLASPTRGFTVVRPSTGGWPTSTASALPPPAARTDKYNDFIVLRGPGGLYFASNSALYRRAADGFEEDPRGKAWGGAFPEVPRTLHFDAAGRLWVQLYIPWQPGTTRLLRLDAQGGIDRLVPREVVELLGYGGARTLYAESTPDGEFLWGGVTLGVLRAHWHNGNTEPAPLAPLLRWISGPDSTGADVRTFRAWNRTPLVVEAAAPGVYTGTSWEFQWRLTGAAEEPWSAFSGQREIQLRGLPPGASNLEVRTRNPLGQLSPAATFQLLAQPPWHATLWARAGFGALALTALAGFVRWRLRGAERERLRLESVIAERTSDLRAAVAKADAASQAKTLFLANMSHELRTPLNAILGYAQLLLRDSQPGERGYDRLAVISNSGEHLLRIINEVLDLAKIEAGKMELHPAPFSLPALLGSLSIDVGHRAAQQGLAFEADLDPALPARQRGDSQKLRQVLENVLGNALKFTAVGTVALAARSVDPVNGVVWIAITDTGPGIAAPDRERIFEAFAQAAEGRPAQPGTGLGLALCQRLLGLMGSKLELESKLGEGSRFFFTLKLPPVHDQPASRLEPMRRISGYAGPRIRVLIVDDVEANRSLLRDLLAPLDFHLQEAVDGTTALERAAAFRPNLVLLDLRLPDMDGFAVAEHLRATPVGQAAKIIALSASALTTTRDEVVAAGCDDFLGKPFRADDLFDSIAHHLRLEWIRADANGNGTPASLGETTKSVQPVSEEELRELLEFARDGAIQPLRERIKLLNAAHGDPILREVAKLAGEFRLTDVASALERELEKRWGLE